MCVEGDGRDHHSDYGEAMKETCVVLAVIVNALALSSHSVAQTRTDLPIPPTPFTGVIKDSILESVSSPQQRVNAPMGAPNVFLFMSDDVGFSMSSAFGGPVPTPNIERLAAAGVRYNRFHTTAICSASRAALLTGRNHHNAATGVIADLARGYPGYDAHIPPSSATVAQILRLNGYNTAMFGKHHNVPPGEGTAAGPFEAWPTGLGFEYFFGFPVGETDQWHPNLYRGTDLLPDYRGPSVLLEHRLADDAITWLHNQKAAAPDRPFFLYYAPGSTHAPHQAPAEYIARFKGRFNQGWDKVREETYQRQLARGIIPPGTKLTPRPEAIPAWVSISPTQRAFAARSMEVAAAMLAYQDSQLGRVLDELQRMGELDKTLVVVIEGDNGASGEGGPAGTTNEWSRAANRSVEDDTWLAANISKLGGGDTQENYPVGWAWAMDTPLRWVKQYASMLGGIRNGMIISWTGHVAHPNSICAEFGHLIDIAPTLLEASHIPAPQVVYGVKQKPLDGQSLLRSLTECDPDRPRTQYFELMGKAGLYQDGWFASNDDGRLPWQTMPATGPSPSPQWTLFDLNSDFSQSEDLSTKYPDRLKRLIQVWHDEAARNNVFPVSHSMTGGTVPPAGPRRFDLWGKDVSIPAHPDGLLVKNVFAGSFALDADIVLDKDQASGVIAAVGSHFAGWSLYLDKGRATFVYAKSTRPDEVFKIASRRQLPKGPARLRVTFTTEGFGKSAHVQIRGGDAVVADGAIPTTFVVPAGVGEMLDAGRDTGVTVTHYSTPHGRLEGDIRHVSITVP
jgi:arylsulfatase A-like enzyme